MPRKNQDVIFADRACAPQDFLRVIVVFARVNKANLVSFVISPTICFDYIFCDTIRRQWTVPVARKKSPPMPRRCSGCGFSFDDATQRMDSL